MAPHKKSRNASKLPLALNPLKSKDVLAVLAERNQAIVPVGAWVEPASPHSSETPAYTSAYVIEEEVKEQLRKKQEALKHFQKQVKHRVNQQIRLRKKKQLQKSFEAAEKEGSIAMYSSDPAHLTPRRTVFPNNLNAAIESARLPPSQMIGGGIEDRENQNQLLQQQAQALSQTMKQARHRLASFKTVSEKNTSVFPDGTRKSFPTQEEHDSEESSSIMIDKKERESLFSWDQQDLLSEDKEKSSSRERKVCFKEPYSDMINEKGRGDFSLAGYQYLPPKLQDQAFVSNQSLYSRQQPSVGTAERWRDLLLGHQHLPSTHRREASSRRQVYDECQSGLNTEFQPPLALQTGVDQEEDKKERQRQYLRYRRLFMDIEREQVKEQQRQKEHRKKIEKIKKKKEQQRYAEEQKLLRKNFYEEPCSGEKISEILAQLQLEEIKGAREKQQQREKEYQRYVDALRAQIQEKMKLYNITLPPLCCCGPDFWDANPDTCANNCIFYKNHKAYTRALHSVISSCDIPEGNSTLRAAIHNFASAHRRTLKNAY